MNNKNRKPNIKKPPQLSYGEERIEKHIVPPLQNNETTNEEQNEEQLVSKLVELNNIIQSLEEEITDTRTIPDYSKSPSKIEQPSDENKIPSGSVSVSKPRVPYEIQSNEHIKPQKTENNTQTKTPHIKEDLSDIEQVKDKLEKAQKSYEGAKDLLKQYKQHYKPDSETRKAMKSTSKFYKEHPLPESGKYDDAQTQRTHEYLQRAMPYIDAVKRARGQVSKYKSAINRIETEELKEKLQTYYAYNNEDIQELFKSRERFQSYKDVLKKELEFYDNIPAYSEQEKFEYPKEEDLFLENVWQAIADAEEEDNADFLSDILTEITFNPSMYNVAKYNYINADTSRIDSILWEITHYPSAKDVDMLENNLDQIIDILFGMADENGTWYYDYFKEKERIYLDNKKNQIGKPKYRRYRR